jgi:hypothetical protein
MKHLFLLFLILSFKINAQDYSKNIEKSTLEFREFFLKKNFSELANFATPKLIENLKTKQDLVYLLTELNKNAESKSVKITNVSFGKNSEILKHNEQLQCSIPFTLEIEDEKRIVKINAGLALISFDKGITWFYAFKVEKDQKLNNEALDLDDRIIIPERTQNVVNK